MEVLIYKDASAKSASQIYPSDLILTQEIYYQADEISSLLGGAGG